MEKEERPALKSSHRGPSYESVEKLIRLLISVVEPVARLIDAIAHLR